MKKIMGIILAVIMLIPYSVVNAATKTEDMITKLQALADEFNGTVTYEDGYLEVNWAVENSESNYIYFEYDENEILYNSGELESYEDAEDVVNHSMYAISLIRSALRVNGYTDEEINTFLTGENNLDYEINGIEYKQTGEAEEFVSDDETSTITTAPMSIKIDVTRANLNTVLDPEFITEATIDDVIDDLLADDNFTTTVFEEKVIYENDVYDDGDYIIIENTYYWDDYYRTSFNLEDDVLTYEVEEVSDYDEAESAESHYVMALQIIAIALENNGYTEEEISAFFESENNTIDFERNGIEIKELGDEQEFVSDDETSTTYFTPVSIKVDLAKANLDQPKVEYKTLNGDKQEVKQNEELTFRFNIEYSKFQEEGKVYMDGKLVDSSNYTSKEGSTIITFKNDFVKSLDAKAHSLKVEVADGAAETSFTLLSSTENPNTGDSIYMYISTLGISFITLLGSAIYLKKELFN